MTHIVVNACGSRSGGGRTYVLALLDELARGGTRGHTWRILLDPGLAPALDERRPPGVEVVVVRHRSAITRVLWEQLVLPWKHGRRSDEVLVSIANFAPLLRRNRSVLLARNALYFSGFRSGGLPGIRLRLEGWLAIGSVKRAAATMTATEAMARIVQPRTRRPVRVNAFGPGLVRDGLPAPGRRFQFVHRTFWGPHKRLVDVLAAIRELAAAHPGEFVVWSACDPRTAFAGSFEESREERELLEDPLVSRHIEFGAYDPASSTLIGDAIVMPSTIESFCFPLAEGLAAGIPIVAADTDFARELCGTHALYYRAGDVGGLAAAMEAVLRRGRTRVSERASGRGLTWSRHVDRLTEECARLVKDERVAGRGRRQ